MKITWKCQVCKDVTVSDSSERHNMDWCKCGESGLDIEEHYTRTQGSVKVIKMGGNKKKKKNN